MGRFTIESCGGSHHDAVVNGVRLHYVQAGPSDPSAPLVVLLHGFPEFWYAWRRQIPALAAAGFRVVAPDLRGYNTSEKPARVGDYRVELLAADAVGLIRHLGHSRAAAVVGHDWGGIVAWFAAMHQPAALERLVILNAPHPQAYLRELRRSRQALLSWYAFAFQIPGLPERLIRRRDFRAVRELLRTDPADRAAFTEADIDEYVRALAQPGALTASINYYRAAFRRGHAGVAQAVRRIDAETLLIWGERDRFLVPSLTEGLDAWVPRLTVKRLPHATHWVHHDAGEVVNGMLIDFLRGRAR